MPYLGNSPDNQTFLSGTDYFSGNGSTVLFTLSRQVISVNDIIVVVENVVQYPGVAYSVIGNQLTFTGTPPSGTNNIYVRYMSVNTRSIGVSDGAITTPKIQDASVTSIKIANGSITKSKLDVANIDGTGATILPTGTTAQRPVSPINGFARYNSTLGFVEFYQNGNWNQLAIPYTIDYLIIAGGGSGGVYSSGSGYVSGNPGSASSFGVYSTIGGGAGTAYNGSTANRNGGSGGGGGSSGGDVNVAGSGTTGQGYAGGTGQYANSVYQGGGGGGAGQVGAAASGTTAGSGGNGLASSITGTTTTRAGGGGGGVYGGGTAGNGGTGGGGAGNGNGSISGIAGTINTGSGGGAGNTVGAGHGGGGAGGYRNTVIGELSGGGSSVETSPVVTPGMSYNVIIGAGGSSVGVTTTSGQGGSGIVIIRYQSTIQRALGGTVTSYTSNSNTYWVHTFTSSGTFTA
jgi:hypothetical protein